MIELGTDNLIDYLRKTGRLSDALAATSHAEVLSGGVSNVVMRVSVPNGQDFVVKQSRAQLRTAAAWFSQPERIWRERDVLDTLQHCAPPGLVPKLLFEDRDNFLFAMEAIARQHVVWKSCLLNGETDHAIARRLGEVLATIHTRTSNDAELRERLADRTIFDELRLDPFYRFVAQRHPELRPALERLIDETSATVVCLVLGDFSPKNILIVHGENERGAGAEPRIALVDFETGHFGDPAFDLGFFLSHLLLKTIKHAARADEFVEMARTFWSAYCGTGIQPVLASETSSGQVENLPHERRIVSHLAACMRARVDGKSTVDYLTSEAQALVREVTRDWLLSPPDRVEAAFDDLRIRLKAACSC
ncbi:MAG TPA: phosphotransferase [Planctomycetaceae bacterium]|nr:phosphotransferase [Planctomycetaceae bacterium]